ncbi:MAG: ATPase P [Sulfurovum sp.]|nr:ATPase P [Sulfurovum sp.]
MLKITIPGMEEIRLDHLLLDYNGTLACDGQIKAGVLERLEKLSQSVKIHVITADTFGSVQEQCDASFIHIHIIGKEAQDRAKLEYLKQLDPQHTVAVGNGRNDALILQEARLGFALLQEEGCATQSLLTSDVLFQSINDALDVLLNANRLVATLRT